MTYWRHSWWHTQNYQLCLPITLPAGLVVSRSDDMLQFVDGGLFQPTCFKGLSPMMNLEMGYMMHQFSQPLPAVYDLWTDYTLLPRGGFPDGVVSTVYLLAVLAVITWFLTIFVFTNYTIKPLMLLKLSLILALAYLFGVVVRLITELHDQQRQGYLHGLMLLETLNNSVWLLVLDLVAVFLLQINQVQVIMRIFQRQKERRLALFVGVVCAVASQVIWGITKFHDFATDNEAGDIMPAFIYLVRIAMAVCYAAIIMVFMLSKVHYLLPYKRIWVISILTIVLIYTPVAFFIADVSNLFVYELSEIFSVVTYVICVVMPWEWCNKFNMIMRDKEKDGVLGRRFYEDEMYEVDQYEIFEDKSDDENAPDDHEQQPMLGRRQRFQQRVRPKVEAALKTLKQTFLNVTDGIIAAGFAVPRSVSVGTEESTYPELQRSNRRNVYVYQRREVVLDFDD